ncbi:MAG TPA: archease [Candidatus Nanopusillus sp.]|nr:archease [Candidatus Nanopusillus sp.]
MVMLREFEYEDHTADVKIVAYGNTPKRTIEALMLGMLNLIYDIDKVEKKEQKEIELEANDIIEVIFELGTRILDIFYVDKFAIGDIRIKNLRRVKKEKEKVWYVRTNLFGEKYDTNKHGFKKEVKAITYHNLDIKRIRKAYWIATMVVDV